MNGDADRAREMKILSDILALALDEAPGVSTNALDAIRQRARASGVTGGALKAAFHRAREDSAFPRVERSAGEGWSPTSARLQIEALQSQVIAAELAQRQALASLAARVRLTRLLALLAGVVLGAGLVVLVKEVFFF